MRFARYPLIRRRPAGAAAPSPRGGGLYDPVRLAAPVLPVFHRICLRNAFSFRSHPTAHHTTKPPLLQEFVLFSGFFPDLKSLCGGLRRKGEQVAPHFLKLKKKQV
ncbi:MAG: hypothetical protein IJU29_09250 [Oscillospiraceae bacterium]|nr:hypothetical protein [Oscillospiraceae bacterium]